MNEAKHTPTPWRVRDNGKAYFFDIVSETDEEVVRQFEEPCSGEGGIPLRADAEFIVRACNCHDDLLAALRRQLANIERWLDSGVVATPKESKSIYEQMKAAVAKAEGRA